MLKRGWFSFEHFNKMIVEQEYRVKLSEIGQDNKITNKAILSDFEDVGGIHSNIAGYGILDIPQTHLTWLLLDWRLQVIRRPNYGEKIKVKTWSRHALKCYAFRDFEVCDEKENIIAIASSKWVLVDTEKEKIIRVSDEVLQSYKPEIGKKVFEDEQFDKIQEPETAEKEVIYTVRRADIDVNNHMHNLNYLDLANEALPEEVYKNGDLNSVRISYKKEIKLGDTVKCKYSFENEKHIITIKSEDEKIIHAIIELN